LCSDSYTGLRALLTPTNKKPSARKGRTRKAMFGVEDAGRWSLLDTFQPRDETQEKEPKRNRKEAIANRSSFKWELLDEEQLERLISIYLQRWGVIVRALLERESFAPPWRILLIHLRKLELRGVLRGGRFIAGIGGEQFAFPETVDALRKFNKNKNNQESERNRPYYCLTASDPLNLINLTLPNRKLPRLLKNRVLYEGGIPIAILESGNVHFLREVDPQQHWNVNQMLLLRKFPTRLRSYLGNR